MNELDPAKIIEALQLQPHPEGGFYKEIYRAGESLAASALPERYGAQRSIATAIYYLLTPGTFSTMHRVRSDEVFHFYLGDAVEQLRLFPDGHSEIIMLGSDIMQGQQIQSVVSHGVWQGARVRNGGRFALLGATVSPGFDFADYEEGTAAELCASFPSRKELISALTRR
jgi:predicted cupin superfamily sugar epimerase